jgi:hypothetical protein
MNNESGKMFTGAIVAYLNVLLQHLLETPKGPQNQESG